MSKKSYQGKDVRIPEMHGGVQVNCCKNPKCDNFGVSPVINKNYNKDTDKRQVDPHYTITGLAKNMPGIRCKVCGDITPIKSNHGIYVEKERLSSYLKEKPLYCPNRDCENYEILVTASPANYYRFGHTSGNQRYQCKVCKKTFSNGSKRRRQRKPEINKSVYRLLMNKVPVKRACEILGVYPQVYYDKIDWLYEQALGFVKGRELRLLNNLHINRLYLSTDRQSHICNWTQRSDKRNTELLAIGTADNRSGYVFGWHFNFDMTQSPFQAERETLELNDYDRPAPHRKHARLWLPRDFELAQTRSENRRQDPSGSISDGVSGQYDREESRVNAESSEVIDGTVKPPADGMLVHSEYTMHGHFFFLKDLFRNVEKVRFYLDQETGIRNAFMTSFQDRVVEHTADAFYVAVSKNMTVDQKDRLILAAQQRVSAITGRAFSHLTAQEKDEAILFLVLEEMKSLHSFRRRPDEWLKYPFATKSEPEKMVSALTDIDGLTDEHQARLYMNSSLYGIDRFFMQARRRVNFFERPYLSGTNARRTWYGYSPYHPAIYIKLAELFRLFYNYIHVGKDKKTPAMRLGLAKGPVTYEKIIYFDR